MCAKRGHSSECARRWLQPSSDGYTREHMGRERLLSRHDANAIERCHRSLRLVAARDGEPDERVTLRELF